MQSRIAWLVVAAVALSLAARPAAHEIAPSVTVHAFVRPEPQRLRLLLRVPVHAMRDIDFPTRGAPGYLDIARADDALRHAAQMWVVNALEVYEGDTRLDDALLLTARASLPSDRSFASYNEALAHVTGPRLPGDTAIVWDQALLDVLIEYPIRSERSAFSFRSDLARLGLVVTTALRFVTPDGTIRAFEYTGDPGMVRLDPRWHQAAFRFVQLGFAHILEGWDHLLFLLCLVIPLRRLPPLILVVTAFTVAHSMTLIASALGLAPDALWFPLLVEVLIAASIVYMALENIIGGAPARRWIIAFAFGLVHGFGFSFALRDTLQFAGSHLLTSLLAFNVGVELGQLLVLAILVPALHVLFRFGVAERVGTIVLSALVAHTAWHWMIERGERLRQARWPAFDTTLAVSALGWAMALLVVGALIWIGRGARSRARALRRT